MASIGTFKKSGDEYLGEIVTLSFQEKNVRIVPDNSATGEKAPTHRVYAGRPEIGAAWRRRSRKTGDEYLSVKLDDPSLSKPIFANLVSDEENGGYALIWSRSRPANGD